MRLLDARRLTGKNLLSPERLAIVQIALDAGESLDAARSAIDAQLQPARRALGLDPDVTWIVRPNEGGATMGHPSPIDRMLVDVELLEWATLAAADVTAGRPAPELAPRLAELRAMLAREASPNLEAIAREAASRGVAFSWDDELVTLGAGARALSFARGEAPDVSSIAWDAISVVPVVFVTGTNGKTTTSRLVARLAREDGRRVGLSSSGGVVIDGVLLEEGDWTGPAGARRVLRSDVDLAVLETARGGVLRRGLALDTCDVAVVTNVAADHLGLDGIDDVDAMAEVKGLVARAAKPSGAVVLNAADERLVALAAKVEAAVTFFADLDVSSGGAADAASLARVAEVLALHTAGGGRAVVARGGVVEIHAEGGISVVARVDAVPLTFDGAARHNVENVLAAVGAASALGVSARAIARGLGSFTMEDNPGRGQIVSLGGVTVFVDYAHNGAGVRAALGLVAGLRARAHAAQTTTGAEASLTVIVGSPGDRTDEEIADVAREVCAAGATRVLVRELAGYERTRLPGEVPETYRRAFAELGLSSPSFAIASSEVDALRRALAEAKPGDFVCLLVHLEHDEVARFFASLR